MSIYLLLSVLLSYALTDGAMISDPRVTFSKGTVEGFVISTPAGKKSDAFLGVPFGEAPIGKMRFKPARPVPPWTGVLEVKTNPPGCYQKVFMAMDMLEKIPLLKRYAWFETQSEDCLKLNVWRPQGVSQECSLPVMVWIYGGAFILGTIAVEGYQGHVLASEEEVIVVSMNYRVGSLGFLYMGNEEVPGNAGLHDQLLALKWVKENIADFGGDPGRITIFGESAGAASVGYHMVSPLSTGLFHRAILQSGVPLSDWAFQSTEEAIRATKSLAKNLNCIDSDMIVSVDCLRNAPADAILKAEPLAFGIESLAFRPTLDKHFLSDKPNVSMDKNKFRKVDVLIGHNENEGSMFLTGFMPFTFTLNRKISVSREVLDDVVQKVASWTNEVARKLVLTVYNDWTDVEDGIKSARIAEKIVSDVLFTCPINRFIRAVVESGRKVYKYVLTHRTSVNHSPEWWGVVHGEDLLLIFGLLLFDSNASHADQTVSRSMMRYWSNFAKFGDPNGDERYPSSSHPVYWSPHNIQDDNEIVIGYNSTATRRKADIKACVLWDTLVPELAGILK